MYKKAYKILKNNMVFIQPVLVLQLIIAMIISFNYSRIQMPVIRIVTLCLVLLLFTACLSGWLYINKYGVLSYNEKDSPEEISEKAIQNLKKFFEGIGCNFIKTGIFCLVIFAIYFVTFYGLYIFCLNYFGIPEFINNLVQISETGTKEQILEYANNIPDREKIKFSNWVMIINTGISIINFFAILYFSVMSFEKKNFIISLYLAIKFLIKNLFKSICIMLFIFLIYIIIQFIPLLLGINSISATIFIITLTLYFNYYVLLVFCFYYDKTQNNSNNRTECIGENSVSDKTCEGN